MNESQDSTAIIEHSAGIRVLHCSNQAAGICMPMAAFYELQWDYERVHTHTCSIGADPSRPMSAALDPQTALNAPKDKNGANQFYLHHQLCKMSSHDTLRSALLAQSRRVRRVGATLERSDLHRCYRSTGLNLQAKQAALLERRCLSQARMSRRRR